MSTTDLLLVSYHDTMDQSPSDYLLDSEQELQSSSQCSGISSADEEELLQHLNEDVGGQNDKEVFQDLFIEKTKRTQHEELQNLYIKGFILINPYEQERELNHQQWQQMYADGGLSRPSRKNAYYSIYKGLNFSVRKSIWECSANVQALKQKTRKSYVEMTNICNIPQTCVTQIEKDVYRTKSITEHFRELRHILVAYCYFTGKPYVQGMNMIAGSLLELLSLSNDEELEGFEIVESQFQERVFWVFVGLMVEKKWKEIFENDLQGLMEKLAILGSLMMQHVPAVYQKIIDYGWNLSIFSQYYIAILQHNTPKCLGGLFLDLFFLEGQNAIHSLIIQMMKLHESTILQFTEQSKLMEYFREGILIDTYCSLVQAQPTASQLTDFSLNFIRVNKIDTTITPTPA